MNQLRWLAVKIWCLLMWNFLPRTEFQILIIYLPRQESEREKFALRLVSGQNESRAADISIRQIPAFQHSAPSYLSFLPQPLSCIIPPAMSYPEPPGHQAGPVTRVLWCCLPLLRNTGLYSSENDQKGEWSGKLSWHFAQIKDIYQTIKSITPQKSVF